MGVCEERSELREGGRRGVVGRGGGVCALLRELERPPLSILLVRIVVSKSLVASCELIDCFLDAFDRARDAASACGSHA